MALADAGAAAPIVLLSVSDSSIESAAAAIGAARGTVVAHTSGSRDVSALEAARTRGALVGGFHPLAAVVKGGPDTSREAYAAVFRGGTVALEGTDEVRARLSPLAVSLGAHPFAIRGDQKPLYHLGASMLAAFSAGLAQVAWDQMVAAGASHAIASAGVGHLLRTVSDNVARAPMPAAALTGPVARGDAAGVARQRRAAAALPEEARRLYDAHVLHNIRLALRAGRIDERTATQLADAVRGASGENHPS